MQPVIESCAFMAKLSDQVPFVEGLSTNTSVITLSLYQHIYSWHLMWYFGYSW